MKNSIQLRDVAPPVAQGRDPDTDDVQPEEHSSRNRPAARPFDILIS